VNKSITLLGMSGAGKTHFSQRLAAWGWEHYSNDFEIAKRLGIDVQIDDLSALSDFIGQVGDPDKGGLVLDDFKKRQKMYMDAEIAVLREMPQGAHVVNDSTGSFCEIEDEALIGEVADRSLLVYIETDAASHKDVIARAVEYPKPLYYPPAQFDSWLDAYCEFHKVDHRGLEPAKFAAWVFPKLFASRLPKYERIAREYGMTVQAKDLHACDNEDQFLELISA